MINNKNVDYIDFIEAYLDGVIVGFGEIEPVENYDNLGDYDLNKYEED